MNTYGHRVVALALCAALAAPGAVAQQFTYPAKGQSAEQQKKDEAECSQWATGQTGIDPSKQTAQAALSSVQKVANSTLGQDIHNLVAK